MAKTYEALQKRGGADRAGWQFLDLQNRKQAGDLDKRILFEKKKNGAKVFNFTSSRPHEGVSTVLVNLVQYIKCKKSKQKILLIDANFKSPCLHSIFKLKSAGLTDILTESAGFEDVVQNLGATNLYAITAGRQCGQMVGNLDQDKLDAALTVAQEAYDLILIDSSPVLTSSDAVTTALVADVTFIVLQAMKIQRDAALKAKSLLVDNECVIGGVVLNRTHQVIPAWAYNIL
jgi:capsular exopolysaccharide synthesis family protein